jgi:hypothetical protein
MAGCVSGDDELTKDNASIAIVGKDEEFTLLEEDDLQPYLDRLELEGGAGGGGGGAGGDDQGGEGGGGMQEEEEEQVEEESSQDDDDAEAMKDD